MLTGQRSASPFTQLAEMWRWRGPVRCAGLAARFLMRPFVDWYIFHIHETSIDPATLKEPAVDAPIVVRLHSLESGVARAEADLQPILAFQPVDVAFRMSAGDSVAIAYHGETVVGCSWFTTRDLPLMWGLDFAVRSDEAVCFGSFVLPEWRGKRIHVLLEQAINAHLYRQGIVRTCGSMSALNPQTLSLAKRTHKRKRMTLFLVHLKGLNWHFHYAQGDKLEQRFHKHVATPGRERSHAEFAMENALLAKPRRIIQ